MGQLEREGYRDRERGREIQRDRQSSNQSYRQRDTEKRDRGEREVDRERLARCLQGAREREADSGRQRD